MTRAPMARRWGLNPPVGACLVPAHNNVTSYFIDNVGINFKKKDGTASVGRHKTGPYRFIEGAEG